MAEDKGSFPQTSSGYEFIHEDLADGAMNDLLEETKTQIDYPQGRDPRTRGHAMAFHDFLAKREAGHDILVHFFKDGLRSAFNERLKNGRSLRPWVCMNLLRLASQKQIMLEQTTLPPELWKFSNETYPWEIDITGDEHQDVFAYAVKWNMAMRQILTDDGEASDPRRKGLGAADFFDDIANKDVNTTKPQRCASIQYVFAELIASGKLPPNPRFLDVGCGFNFGLEALLNNHGVFASVDVIKKVPVSELSNLTEEDLKNVDPELTHEVNTTLAAQIPFGESYGVDLVSLKDEEIKKWVRFSHYASELADPKTLEEFDRLYRMSLEGGRHVQADITKGTPEALKNYKCDAVTMVTVLDLLNEQEQQKLRAAAEQYLDPNGPKIMVIVDFAVEDPKKPGGIRLLEHMTVEPLPYRVLVLDLKEPNPTPKTWLAWTGGRCQKAVIVEN